MWMAPVLRGQEVPFPLTRVSVRERANQFSEDLCAGGGALYLVCKFCAYSVNITRV